MHYKSERIIIPRLVDRPRVIALLLTPKLTAHCQIMRGFSDYIREKNCDWNIVLRHELKVKKGDAIDLWFDGVVSDFNNGQQRKMLANIDIPVVGLSNGVEAITNTDTVDNSDHPVISVDNENLVRLAFEHLVGKGHKAVAYYNLRDDEDSLWSASRLLAYQKLQTQFDFKPYIYEGNQALFSSWMEEVESLRRWVDGLPKPCGVIVSSDLRARTLVGVCEANETIIPDEVSIVSIGDMDVSEFFHRTSLSAVDPNYEQMGYQAARMMDSLLDGKDVPALSFSRPDVVDERASSDYRSVDDRYVLRALHFIRLNACKGIKVQQVVDYSGCSRTVLESRFRIQVGHSIHQEIHTLKLNNAKKMLLETDLSVKNIASQCGYPSLQYLYGLFRKEEGITPSDYREQACKAVS